MDFAQDVGLANQRLNRLLNGLEIWLRQRSLWMLGILAALIATIKSGVTGSDAEVWSLNSWPYPVDMYPPLTYGMRSLAFFFGLEDSNSYSLIGLILILVFVFVIVLLTSRRLIGDPARWFILIVLSGPFMWIATGRLVHSDTFVLLGAALVVLAGKRVWWAVPGIALAVLGSPEQAVVLSLCLLLLSLVPRYSAWRSRAAIALVFSAAAWIALSLWAGSLGVGTRMSVLPSLIRRSVEIFLTQLPLTLYSAFGIAALVILYAALNERVRYGLIIISAAFLIPLLFTAITTDQTRILVITSSATVLLLIKENSGPVVATLRRHLRYPLAISFIAVILQPAIEVTGWSIRVPWINYYTYFQAYIIDSLLI